jgi:hypothetical protein
VPIIAELADTGMGDRDWASPKTTTESVVFFSFFINFLSSLLQVVGVSSIIASPQFNTEEGGLQYSALVFYNRNSAVIKACGCALFPKAEITASEFKSGNLKMSETDHIWGEHYQNFAQKWPHRVRP